MDNPTVINRVQAELQDAILATSEFRSELRFEVKPEALLDVVTFLRDDPELSYTFLESLTGVDYLGRDPRFEVVYHLLSMANHHRICLKVGLPEQNPHVASLTSIWPTANYQERETFDMFGVIFDDHPSLERILMPEDWIGHPLRKDVALGYEEVAFTINREQIDERKPYAEE